MIHIPVKKKLFETGTCDKVLYITESGEKIKTPKKKYETQDEAIEVCKRINNKSNQFHKVVPYRCKHCGKFHIGKNGNINKKLNDK